MSGDTPLLGALANMRHKMTRQTMRFLEDAVAMPDARPDARPPSAPLPTHLAAGRLNPAVAPARPKTPPPADQGPVLPSPSPSTPGCAQGPRHRRALQRGQRVARAARACPARWRRWGRGLGVCCIRVQAPSISISVRRRGLHGAHAKTTCWVKEDVDSLASGSSRAAPSSSLEMCDAQSRCSDQRPACQTDQDRVEKEPPAQGRPVVDSGAGEPRKETPELKGSDRQALVQRASNESLNTYVRRKACTIMHSVAKNMAWFERQDAARTVADSRERLLQQVSRVAAYTAASRHLRHATSLYVVASVTSRRARRGVARYRKLACPPHPAEAGHPLAVEPPAGPARPVSSSAKTTSAAPPTAVAPAPAPHINDLPKALLLKIFSMLNHRELSLHVAPVCRAWHRLARSREFWREITFDAAFHQYSAQSVCRLLEATPGLWTLELVACRDVDLILAQVCQTCRKLRTLVLDSCTVSQQRQARLQAAVEDKDKGSVLESVLEQCICLQYLIVAFTPHLYTDGFFSLLGRRCWSMQCFLVSADDADVRKFCESLSDESRPGGEDAEGGAEALLVSLTGSWTRTVPPPARPAATASDNCHAAHPPRETAGLRRRVAAVRTRNRLLRVLALRPDPHRELRLLQWRLADSHATLDYFGVEARLCLQ